MSTFSQPINEDASPAPAHRLFSVAGMVIATFLGALTGGGVLLAINYFRLGQKRQAWMSLVISALATAALFGVGALIPDSWRIPNMVFVVPQLILMQLVAKSLQGDTIEAHKAAGGRMSSNWLAGGIGLISAIVVLGTLFAVLSLMPDPFARRVEISPTEEVYLAGDATDADAQQLANGLTELGMFGKGAEITVGIDKTNGTYTISLILDNAPIDQDTRDAFTFLAGELGDRYFGRPINVRICDGEMNARAEWTVK